MLRDFSKEKFDIVIQAGQSNSQGHALGEATTPFVTSSEILYLNDDFTISQAREDVLGNQITGNFSLSFCTKYLQDGRLQAGRKLLIIRAGVGGTGFSDKRWGMKDDLYLRMMEMIKTAIELNLDNKLISFLWHQGETDAILKASLEVHYMNLFKLINSVREGYNCANLPFIAGDFVSHWKDQNIEICTPVVTAMKQVCLSIGNAQFVETDGLQSNDQMLQNEDSIHFCREAINQLGLRYYDAFIKASVKS